MAFEQPACRNSARLATRLALTVRVIAAPDAGIRGYQAHLCKREQHGTPSIAAFGPSRTSPQHRVMSAFW